jgi:diamine N-acetyltransferase
MHNSYVSYMHHSIMHHLKKEQPEIRKAGRADIPAIIAIIGRTWEPTYGAILSPEQLRFMEAEVYNPAALEKQMREGQDFFLLFSAGHPAGFASCSPAGAGTFKLNKLYVDPAYQGKDFGKLLIGQVEQEARQRGGLFLILNVNRFNKAKSFYEKLGYTIIREEDIPIGDYLMNDYVLQKAL